MIRTIVALLKCVSIVITCVLLWYVLAVVAVAAGGAIMWVLGL